MGRRADLSGYTVGVTATRGGRPQADLFRRSGASVVLAAVCDGRRGGDWPLPADPEPALHLIDLVCGGAIDAVTFTTVAEVRNFMTLADRNRLGRNVLTALNRGVIVACAGPGPATAAVEEGITHPVHADRRRPAAPAALVRLVADHLAARRRSFRIGASELVLQGSLVLVDRRLVALTESERAVLAKLVDRPGTTVSRRVLLRHVWKDPTVDPVVLDTAVTSLRFKLGPPGHALEFSTRRGYRLRATEWPGNGQGAAPVRSP
jgi:uroporphyrinogen-III synthase